MKNIPLNQIDNIQQEINILHIQHIKAILWKEVIENSLKYNKLICKEMFEEVEGDTREIFQSLRNSGEFPGIFQDAAAEFRQEYQQMLREKD